MSDIEFLKEQIETLSQHFENHLEDHKALARMWIKLGVGAVISILTCACTTILSLIIVICG